MTVNDIPLISFFQRVLDPLIIMGSLYAATVYFEQDFTGYSLVLMILAFFVSSAVFQHVDPYRTWRSGRMLAYARDIVVGWLLTVAVLLLLGRASGLWYFYDERVMLAWIVAVPLLMLASHLGARRRPVGKRSNSEVRSVVIIGANDVGLKFAAICEHQENLFMQVDGFFDDRLGARHPPALRHPVLGKMGDIATYVRARQIKMIFISQPISAQPRIRKLLEEVQDTTATVYFLPDIYIFDLMQARFDNVGGMPSSPPAKPRSWA